MIALARQLTIEPPLLHHLSANGIDNFQQMTPPNATTVAEILLAAGAEVDAECDAYGGGWTTLPLTASSEPAKRHLSRSTPSRLGGGRAIKVIHEMQVVLRV